MTVNRRLSRHRLKDEDLESLLHTPNYTGRSCMARHDIMIDAHFQTLGGASFAVKFAWIGLHVKIKIQPQVPYP